jgi:hypothetical protein
MASKDFLTVFRIFTHLFPAANSSWSVAPLYIVARSSDSPLPFSAHATEIEVRRAIAGDGTKYVEEVPSCNQSLLTYVLNNLTQCR